MILTQIEVIHNVTVDVNTPVQVTGGVFPPRYSIQCQASAELSLFVVLYADRIGVLGVYWIPESLVCHGHPPTRCHAPTPPLTPDLTTVYRVSLELSLCVERSQNRHFPTTSGHLVPSLWDLHMFYLLRPILFSELVISPDYALRISLGTFSILLIFITNYLNKIKRNFEKNEACVWMICSGLISLNK